MVLTRKQSAEFCRNRDECEQDNNCSLNMTRRRRTRVRLLTDDCDDSCTSVVACQQLEPQVECCNGTTSDTCNRRLRCVCFYFIYIVSIVLLSIIIYSVFISYSRTFDQIEELKGEINILRNEILANQQYGGKAAKPTAIDTKLISNDLINIIENSFGRENLKIINELSEIKSIIEQIDASDSKSYDAQFELILARLDAMQKKLGKQMSAQSTSLTSANKHSKKDIPQAGADRVDYAAESLGGEILSTDNTELLKTYHLGSIFGWIENTPRMVIQPSIYPGECFGFTGQTGSLVIKLMARVFIDSVTIGHIPKDLSPSGDLSSAPRNIIVSGLTTPSDTQPTALATLEYDANKNQVYQTFPVVTGIVSFQFVRFNITSNHGHLNHTCLYRVRVHGKLDDS